MVHRCDFKGWHTDITCTYCWSNLNKKIQKNTPHSSACSLAYPEASASQNKLTQLCKLPAGYKSGTKSDSWGKEELGKSGGYGNDVAKVNNRAVLPRQSTQAEIGKALVCNLLCRRRAVLLFDTTSISIFSPAPLHPKHSHRMGSRFIFQHVEFSFWGFPNQQKGCSTSVELAKENFKILAKIPTRWSLRLLVYSYMYIESIITKWIITNIARGLSYVRRECRQVIAYLDIKPHKILLDDSFNTKFTDYLLPKLIKMDKNGVITRMRNTPGCMVPKWLPSQISNR
jgi:hypothetical protein